MTKENTRTKLAHMLYSARKKASAPVDMALYVSRNSLISLMLEAVGVDDLSGVDSSTLAAESLTVNSSNVTLLNTMNKTSNKLR